MPPSTNSSSGAVGRLRDFTVRFGVGVGLVAILSLSLWLCRWALVVLIGLFMALAVHELAAVAKSRGWRPAWMVVAVGGAALLIVEYGGWLGDVFTVGFIGSAVLLLAVLAWRLRGDVHGYLADVGVSALMIIYLPLLLTFVIAMLRSDQPIAQMATYVAIIVIGDSGAYIMGSVFGRRKLAPHISPGKTWEGLIGCLLWAVAVGIPLGIFVLGAPWWQGAVLGITLGAAAVVGDMAESAIKRDVGVKDMGKLLPGHGGAMDRLDSLLFCAPIAWAMMNLWMT